MTNLRILHCHSTFSLGGKEARAVRLMNAFGGVARHTILSAVPDALGAREAIDKEIRVEFPDNAPSLEGKPSFARYRQMAGYMQRFDLILTYNWGAMDAVMTRRMFYKDVPPLVHHEDGFNADESEGLKAKRNWFRRLGLPAAHALVVPSQTLEQIALNVWKQPRERVHRISNGIAVAAYGRGTKSAIPGLTKQRGDVIIGTLAGLRAVKNLPMLVRAVAAIPGARLVIVGEGPDRDAIISEANRVGFAHRLVLPGFMPDPYRYIGHFDIFALSSHSEQFPISLVEAMAAGLPVAATDVGDVRNMVASENERFVVRGEIALRDALRVLVSDPALRQALGRANRAKALADYGEAAMIASYAELYEAAVGWPGALQPGNVQKVKLFPPARV
jgi:L-malate glycosyltransferase